MSVLRFKTSYRISITTCIAKELAFDSPGKRKLGFTAKYLTTHRTTL